MAALQLASRSPLETRDCMPGKILVLGATGHVGAPLVRELVAAKEEVKAASRHTTLVAGAEVVPFDYADQKSYQTAFDGVDRVFVLLPGGYTNAVECLQPVIQSGSRSKNQSRASNRHRRRCRRKDSQPAGRTVSHPHRRPVRDPPPQLVFRQFSYFLARRHQTGSDCRPSR